MFKILFVTFIYLFGISASLNAQVFNNQKEKNLADDVKIIIQKILNDERKYRKLDVMISESNDEISSIQLKIDDMNAKRALLEEELSDLKEEQVRVESNIIKLTAKRYSKSMAIKYAEKKSARSIVDNEVYVVLFKSIKMEVAKYNKISSDLSSKIEVNLRLTNKLNKVTLEQRNLITYNENLKKVQEKNIKALKEEHKYYVKKLEQMNKDQDKMKNILTDLSIVKNSKQKKAGKIKNITPSSKEFESAVKDISKNSTNVSVYGYNGKKTIPPIKKYTITNKFGKYYDAVYKAELFNKSVSLKTKKVNTRVRSMLDGKIFFIKRDAGRLKNIVIVKYANDLSVIYSNLDELSSKISVGKKVLKGYTLGRVDTTLILQATKNNRYINPEKLFK